MSVARFVVLLSLRFLSPHTHAPPSLQRSYDFFGSWSPTTGVNAPLYDQGWGGEDVKGFSVDGCVHNWINGGGSPSAINIGLVGSRRIIATYRVTIASHLTLQLSFSPSTEDPS